MSRSAKPPVGRIAASTNDSGAGGQRAWPSNQLPLQNERILQFFQPLAGEAGTNRLHARNRGTQWPGTEK